jgi:pilus assembly protein CpaF
MQDIFAFEQIGIDNKGKAYGRHVAAGIRPTNLERLKACGCRLDTGLFERQVLCEDEDVDL